MWVEDELKFVRNAAANDKATTHDNHHGNTTPGKEDGDLFEKHVTS